MLNLTERNVASLPLGTVDDLLVAAAAGLVADVQRMLATGVDVEPRDAQGHSPLLLATLRGCRHTVAALLQAGADPNRPNHVGLTPIEVAIHYGYGEINAMLRKAGAIEP